MKTNCLFSEIIQKKNCQNNILDKCGKNIIELSVKMYDSSSSKTCHKYQREFSRTLRFL